MKILVDENIPLITVKALSNLNHDVKDIRGTNQEGTPDELLWEMSKNEGRLLISTDKGFAKYRNEQHFGIIIVRLRKPKQNKIHQSIIRTISQFQETDWHNLLVVVRDNVQSIWKSK